MKQKPDLLTGKPGTLFFWYAIPTIMGMLAISSASVIDGIFVGNVVGAQALAAVNMAMPFFGVTFSLSIMFSVGGSVQCGRFLGENKENKAARVFSQIFFSSLLISIFASLPVLIFPEATVKLLGANPEIMPDVINYLKTYCWFLPLIFMGISLTNFVRINQAPGLVSFALVFSALLNFFLDWLLIVNFHMGLRGAAIASGFSQAIVFFILLSSFFGRKSRLYLIRPNLDIAPVLRAIFNGFSEFVNETSGGLLVLIFNLVLIKKSGIDAVAAFAVINFIFYLWFMVAYSTGQAIQAPVSINLGADQANRSVSFFKFALFFNLILGSLIIIVLLLWPDVIMNIFLDNTEETAKDLIRRFLPFVLPVFLFSGINIVISAFFTALEKAVSSLVIAVLRTLILPICFVSVFYYYFEFHFIFLAIPLAELVTLGGAGWMLHTVLSHFSRSR